MKKIKMIAILMIAAAVFSAAPVFAEAEEIDGRTVALKGTRGSVSGVLVYEKDEWYLDAGGKKYELHLGMPGHDGKTTASMKEGDKATVDGFILENHIAPVTLVSAGKSYSFRNEDGSPVWAGRGNRRNSVYNS